MIENYSLWCECGLQWAVACVCVCVFKPFRMCVDTAVVLGVSRPSLVHCSVATMCEGDQSEAFIFLTCFVNR